VRYINIALDCWLGANRKRGWFIQMVLEGRVELPINQRAGKAPWDQRLGYAYVGPRG
jgi:hypothetical protein